MPGSDLRLLALDGGGVRGLSALMILEQLMEAVDPDAPPKPCDYFDMIGGTSTGGLIAIMLGRLRMSVADCITAYLSLSNRVFRKTRHRVTVNGQIQGRFDADELARAVKEVVKQQGLQEDALLKDESTTTCKVFVCATSKETSETVCLTSYRTPRGIHNVTIWEACRATSAATSFFDPIAIGRFGEEFVDGATGANNPVRELWDQAQLAWGPGSLEGKVKCVVSIGTGVPSLKAFKDDVFNIGQTLAAIATETEQTAERFRRERPLLDSTGRYYRFNVVRGLEDIGLEEAEKFKEMAAATRRYISSQEVHTQMQACVDSIAGREYFGEYQTVFSLEGVPRTSRFVDRPAEMAELERVLLPRLGHNQRQKTHVLHGLGGIGKTQLAVEFARRHHRRFSSVFWFDGCNEDSLKRSIASCAGRIPQGQIPETSRQYAADASADIDAVVKDVMAWLARPDNTAWLLIFDNVDREYKAQGGDPDAYDVRRYLSGADHGSVLVTTRLARLEQLGESQQLGKVTEKQAQAILKSWYTRIYDAINGERLLELLDGLPLAIAQAGAYLQQSGVGLETYLRLYEQQWQELMSMELIDELLQDYPDRNVWTTWVISYKAICRKHEATGKLLLLWSFLGNNDLWYGLFASMCQSSVAERQLTDWISDIANNELTFNEAMRLLRNYSLIERREGEMASYSTHPVVHRWAYHYQGKDLESKLTRLAIITVGCAVPLNSTPDYTITQRRLIPHAQACSAHLVQSFIEQALLDDNMTEADLGEDREKRLLLLEAMNRLGLLYLDQAKLAEAEKIFTQTLQIKEERLGPTHKLTLDTVGNLGALYKAQGKLLKADQMFNRALQGYEEALGSKHTSTLSTVNNLGFIYYSQGKLGKAEQMYERALRGKEEALGPSHTSILQTVSNLGGLYKAQGKLGEAEQMYERALRGYEEALGPSHTSTLDTVNNLGLLCTAQGKLGEAEQMYERALRGKEEALGPSHSSTLDTVNNLGGLYARQGKLGEAKQMYERALRGYEETLEPKHISILSTVNNLGLLYVDQGNLGEAEQLLKRALQGKDETLGPEHASTLDTINNLGNLYKNRGRLGEAEQMYQRALRGYEKALGPTHTSTLGTVNNLGFLYADQGKLGEAGQLLKRALQGYEKALGPKHISTLGTVNNLGGLYARQGKLGEAEQMFERALRGYEEAFGPEHSTTLTIVKNLSQLSKAKLATDWVMSRLRRDTRT